MTCELGERGGRGRGNGVWREREGGLEGEIMGYSGRAGERERERSI